MNKEKAQITLELAHLEGRVSNDDILKARTTKYYKREGSPGSYKYYYTKGDYQRAKGGQQKELDTGVGGKEITNFKDLKEKEFYTIGGSIKEGDKVYYQFIGTGTGSASFREFVNDKFVQNVSVSKHMAKEDIYKIKEVGSIDKLKNKKVHTGVEKKEEDKVTMTKELHKELRNII